MTRVIPVVSGEGVGAEVTRAVLTVLREAGCGVTFEAVGSRGGDVQRVVAAAREHGLVLLGPADAGGPTEIPPTALRTALGLHSTIRPLRSHAPILDDAFRYLDLVIVRAVDAAGAGSLERRLEAAFEFARQHARGRVTWITDASTTAHEREAFARVASAHGGLRAEAMDAGEAGPLLVELPERFDVIVHGPGTSEPVDRLRAGLSGSRAVAGCIHTGDAVRVYEAASMRRAPEDPSGLLLAAVLLLRDLGDPAGETIENAWLSTLEDGILPRGVQSQVAGATEVDAASFASALIERLGERPSTLLAALPVRTGQAGGGQALGARRRERDLMGVDVYFSWEGDADVLGRTLARLAEDLVPLREIANRGVTVWPNPTRAVACSDAWRCRFGAADGSAISHAAMRELLDRLAWGGFEFVKIETVHGTAEALPAVWA